MKDKIVDTTNSTSEPWWACQRNRLAPDAPPLHEVDSTSMRYYDLEQHWTTRIEPHLADKKLNDILVRDFNKYTFGRWRLHFTTGQYPADFDSLDSRYGHPGRYFGYWQYVCSRASHWLVNFALRLASLAEPARPWQIVTCRTHSTVWDGQQTLFELNYLAFGVSAQDCWKDATTDGALLRPGVCLKTYSAPYTPRKNLILASHAGAAR
jgi:hypothetical protein